MKPYKETLIEILEAKREHLLDEIENASTDIALATRNLEIYQNTVYRADKDIAFIDLLLTSLTFDPTTVEPFDYMDSDVA